MLRKLNEIIGNVLEAKNGEIGRCKDFLFDDEFWDYSVHGGRHR